jgi:hypothetical protein
VQGFKEDEMAPPEKSNELNRVDEQGDHRANAERIEEHRTTEDREYRDQRAAREHRHNGHDFAMDLHPDRYPRGSLSRLEEGILDDDQKRHDHDRLGSTIPDLEDRVDDSRNLSRTLMVAGGLLLIFAWILAWWVGWDVRSGNAFFSTMGIICVILGLGLLAWATVERQRVVRLLRRMRMPAGLARGEQTRSGDRAA